MATEACCAEFARNGQAHTEVCSAFDASDADPAVRVELDRAIADVKRDLGVETAEAHIIAGRLPERLRGPFWRRAVERYLAEEAARTDRERSGEPQSGDFRMVDGRDEIWLETCPGDGVWVCAAPDPDDEVTGFCGQTSPCTEHERGNGQ